MNFIASVHAKDPVSVHTISYCSVRGRPSRWIWLAAAAIAGWVALTIAQESGAPADVDPVTAPRNADLDRLIDELAWLKAEKVYVTSVSRHREEAFRAAAAVTVITSDDIRRSGARTFPEALRLAPGISVARINANKSAVASRGFSNIYAEHLLVLIDGRSIYQVNNSGVNWILEDYLLEDVDRIEVVRGPGGTLWGANAVNGVVNIVTKRAQDTAGGYYSGGVGTEQRGFLHGRYGDRVGDAGWLRGYVKYSDRESHRNGFDRQETSQGGMRFDRETEEYRLTLAGDAMGTVYGDKVLIPTFTTPVGPDTPKTPIRYEAERANARAQFTRTWSEEMELQAQAYFDHSRDVSPDLGSVQLQDVYDVDMQMRFPVVPRLNTMVGIGYRYLPSSLNDHALFGWNPNRRSQQLFSAFVHNEVELVEDRLRVTLGVKVEHNDFTGLEWQPNARVAWTPNEHHTVWAAVSRAVQVPGRNVNDVRQPIVPIDQLFVAGLPTYVSFNGNTEVDAQELIGYEAGYRVQPLDNWSVDVTTYYNIYHDLVYGVADFAAIGPGPVPGTLLLPSTARTGGHGETYGFELSTEVMPHPAWRVIGSYALFAGDLVHPVDGVFLDVRKDPRHQVLVRSRHDLPGHVEFDAIGRWVSGLRGRFQSVNGYFGLDLRLGWQATESFEIALVGQNLIEPRHFEYVEDTGVRAEVTPVPRGGYLQLTYVF